MSPKYDDPVAASAPPTTDPAPEITFGPLNCRVVDGDGRSTEWDFAGSPMAGDCVSFFFPDRVADPARARRGGGGPNILALMRQAADRAIALAPAPDLTIAPSAIGLTGLPTFVWLSNQPTTVEAVARAGGLEVTAQATPTSYRWDFGDGADLVTTDTGRAWTPYHDGTIEHTYETRGRYDLSVSIVWAARWRLNEGDWQSLGYFVTSDRVDYPVRQIVAVLTRSASW